MSSTKVPIYLKRGSRKGKKEKLRDILSSDMISPPLGDFRHTIHVGSGGESDTFGDISFLQGKFHLLPRGEAPSAAAAPPPPCPRLAAPANGEAEPFLSHAGSLLSLHVDLGPSILEDVLQVMDRHRAERGADAKTTQNPNPAPTDPPPIGCGGNREFQLDFGEQGQKPSWTRCW
uniref:CRIB domain-containing protein n=1 Tax=Taeniopygia guttata TaxID=59729 RepID=A0A674GEU6_TAEGU